MQVKSETVGRPERRKYQPGQAFGDLTLVRYAGKTTGGNQLATFDCSCGGQTTVSLHNVVAGKTTDCADRSVHPNPRRAGEHAQIGSVHHLMGRELGSARTKPCWQCGLVSDGNCWAFRHSSYEARTQWAGKQRGQVYSVDPRDYAVMCRRCHHAWDVGVERTVTKGALSLPHIAFGMAYVPDYDAPPTTPNA